MTTFVFIACIAGTALVSAAITQLVLKARHEYEIGAMLADAFALDNTIDVLLAAAQIYSDDETMALAVRYARQTLERHSPHRQRKGTDR